MATLKERRELAYRALAERGLAADGVRAFLEHPRNDLLVMEGSRFYYAPPVGAAAAKQPEGLVSLKGLTSLLREFYWPTHSPWNKKKVEPTSAASALIKKKKGAAWASVMSRAKGNVRGSIVHRQLAEYVNLGRDVFLQQNPQVHPLVRMALAALEKASLYPVVAEYRVACVDARLGTALDLGCINFRTGHMTWLEVKTCASRRAFEATAAGDVFAGRLGRLASVHKTLPCSDCSRAKVQLGVSVLMAIEGTGHKGAVDAAVLLLADDQREGLFYDLTETFLTTYAVPVYLDIQKRLPEWRKEARALRELGRTR